MGPDILRPFKQLAALGDQQRRSRLGQWTEPVIQPDQMLFGTYHRPALLAHRKLEFVSLERLFSVQSGQVPLIGQLYPCLGRAVVLAVAAEDARVISVADLPDGRIGLEIINHSQTPRRRAHVHARPAANARIQIELRLAPVSFRHLARHRRKLGRESTSRQRRRYCYNGFLQLS